MKNSEFALQNICAKSRRLMRKKPLRRTLRFAFLLCLFAVLGIYAAVGTAAFALAPSFGLSGGEPLVYAVCGTLSCLLTFLFVTPLWEGILAFAFHAAEKERADFATLFAFYTDARLYRFALLRGMGRMGRLLLWSVLTVTLATGACHASKTVGGAVGALILALTFWFLLFLPFFFLYAAKDRFLLNALKTENEAAAVSVIADSGAKRSHFPLAAISRKKIRFYRGRVTGLTVRFLPLFLLSVLLAGIPFFYTLPYFITARAVLRSRILNE